jgi:hypothetical protein
VKELLERWRCRPIRNCPGRYIVDCPPGTTPQEIVGTGVRVTQHRVAAARDPVFVAACAQGGLISYLRADGTFLHTLNDEEGFRRKLGQLGI